MKTVSIFLACAALLLGADPGPSWNHNPADLKRGPAVWANVDPLYRTCGAETGKKQSPVDIVTARTIGAAFQPLVFTDKGAALALENTDHVLEVEYAEGSTVTTGSQPTDSWVLKQWHLHVPSEHRIDGRQYAAELHLVHQNSIGEVLVVAVLMDDKMPPKANLDRVIQGFPRKKSAVPVTSGVPSIASLLPVRRDFYRYAGSLTTPACTEGVQWFVMTNPVGITKANVKTLHGLVGEFTGYEGYPDNNRPDVPLNGRTILRSLP